MKGRVKVVKSVKVIDATDKLNPRHRVMYIVYSDEPMELRAKLVCDGDVRELSLRLARTRRYIVELLVR